MFTFIYVMYNHTSEIPSEEMYHMTMTRHDHAVNTANWRDECLEETWWKPCYICYVSGHEFFVIKKGSAGWICELVSKNGSTHLDITGQILSWSLCDLVPFGHRFSRFFHDFSHLIVSLSHCLIWFRWISMNSRCGCEWPESCYSQGGKQWWNDPGTTMERPWNDLRRWNGDGISMEYVHYHCTIIALQVDLSRWVHHPFILGLHPFEGMWIWMKQWTYLNWMTVQKSPMSPIKSSWNALHCCTHHHAPSCTTGMFQIVPGWRLLRGERLVERWAPHSDHHRSQRRPSLDARKMTKWPATSASSASSKWKRYEWYEIVKEFSWNLRFLPLGLYQWDHCCVVMWHLQVFLSLASRKSD